MSRRGDCWDNAVAESFFATLKTELVYQSHWQTRAAARTAIFEYVESFYNRRRRHSSLAYLSPADFERLQSNWEPNPSVHQLGATSKNDLFQEGRRFPVAIRNSNGLSGRHGKTGTTTEIAVPTLFARRAAIAPRKGGYER
jgi:hypothetical protein